MKRIGNKSYASINTTNNLYPPIMHDEASHHKKARTHWLQAKVKEDDDEQ